jgi:hypothetical protein
MMFLKIEQGVDMILSLGLMISGQWSVDSDQL